MSLSSMRALSTALILASGFAHASALAADLPPIPDRPAAEQFKDAPAPWRDYLIQARAAERVADPLQRCLQFPDLPDNEWPAGHAAARCRDHAAKAAIDQEVRSYLERGDFAGLETRLDQMLAHHFDRDPGEDIHYAFDVFDDQLHLAKVDAWTAAWLQQRPDSPYANLARGVFYETSAWDARGTKFSRQTPRENLRRMSDFVGRAIPLLDTAIRSNPRLMPAYEHLLDAALVDSRHDDEARAIKSAAAVDPACVGVATKRMQTMQPRWGGSYEDMLSYSAELARYVPGRPQLANAAAAPFADRGNWFVVNDQDTREAADVLDIAVRKSSDEDALNDAAEVAYNLSDAPPDVWKGLAYLLQESRFRVSNAWGNGTLARTFVHSDPEWSLRYASRLLSVKPDAYAHYMLGAGYYNSRRFDDAEREYLIAANDPEQRKAALSELADMWLFADSKLPAKARAAKAKPIVDRLLAEYPQLGIAWYLRVMQGLIAEHRIDMDSPEVRNFLKYYDRANPRQTLAAQRLQGIGPETPEAKRLAKP